MINIIINTLPILHETSVQKLLNLLIEIIPVIVSGSVVALFSGMLAARRTQKERVKEKLISNLGQYTQKVRNFLIEINDFYQILVNLYIYEQKLNETGKVSFVLDHEFQTNPLIEVVNNYYNSWFSNRTRLDTLVQPQESLYRRIIDKDIAYIQNPNLLQEIIAKFDHNCRDNLVLVGGNKLQEHNELIELLQKGTYPNSKYSILDFKVPVVEYLVRLESEFTNINGILNTKKDKK